MTLALVFRLTFSVTCNATRHPARHPAPGVAGRIEFRLDGGAVWSGQANQVKTRPARSVIGQPVRLRIPASSCCRGLGQVEARAPNAQRLRRGSALRFDRYRATVYYHRQNSYPRRQHLHIVMSIKMPPFEHTAVEDIKPTVDLLRSTFTAGRTRDVEYRLQQLRKLYWG